MTISKYALYLAGNGRKVKTASVDAVAEPLSASSVPCDMVIMHAISTNTGVVIVGTSTACASTGSGRSGLPAWAGSTSPNVEVSCADLANIYIDGISTEGVYYAYFLRTVP